MTTKTYTSDLIFKGTRELVMKDLEKRLKEIPGMSKLIEQEEFKLDQENLDNLERFNTTKIRRGEVYKVIFCIDKGYAATLILEKNNGERYHFNTGAYRAISAELKSFCLNTKRESPVGLELVVQKTFIENGITCISLRERGK